MSGAAVLVPITITTAMLSSSTIAEPAAGETAWNAATNYTVGQECILTSTHRVYESVLGGVNATSPDATIGLTPTRWIDKRATQRWAAFDAYVNTQSSIVTPLTYVLRPGLFNSISTYGLDGATLSISIKDAPAGTVFYTKTVELLSDPIDHYDYYFGQIKTLSKVFVKDILPYADPEVTITITAGSGVTVKAGMIAIGDLRQIGDDGTVGGVLKGAKAKPITYSYINTDEFGTTKIIRRSKATDMDLRVFVPTDQADSILATIQDVLDVPAAWIGSDAAGFAGLNVFGLASGDVSYEGIDYSTISIQVKGVI